MPWADVNGIRMYYESHGEGQAIIFAHGAGGNHLSWWQQVPHFREKYRCITFDHRGFGRSAEIEGGPGGLAYPEDLRALIDSLGIARAYLVAQSMGGGTCMGFTAAYASRVIGLAMCDTTGAMSDESLTEKARVIREGRPRVGLDDGAYNPTLRTERPHMAFLYDSIRATNPPRPQPAPGAPPPERDPRYVATTEKLAKLSVPVLFIAGSDDALVPAEVIKHASTLVPGARYAEVPGSGHSVYFEKAPEFNRILSGFIESVERAGVK